MKGRIFKINRNRGMVAVFTETEEFSIFEMTYDNNFNEGDVIRWGDSTALGSCEVKNLSTNEIQEVYFQNHGVNRNNVEIQLR